MNVGFWPRMSSAVVCWFLTMITLSVVVAHYMPTTPPLEELWMKLVLVLAASVGIIAALVAILLFWLWVWTRRYWG